MNEIPENGKTNGEAAAPQPHQVPLPTALQFAAACTQVGAALCGLHDIAGGHVQLGLPQTVECTPAAQALLRQLEAGLATVRGVMRAATGQIVAPY